MEDIKALQEQLRMQRPVSWEQLPDFPLYMDQVLSYMERQYIRFDGEDALTAAMVNNYTKSGLVLRADGKKYNQEHLAYLTAVGILKHVLSTKDMDLLIREELQGARSIPDGYAAFCNSLDSALGTVAEEVALRGETGVPLEDSAFRFALLSYAAGVASNRYVALLRAQREAEQAEETKKTKKEND